MEALKAVPRAPTAGKLPALLNRFFEKYPPTLYATQYTGQTIPTKRQKIAVEGNKKTATQTSEPSPSIPNATASDVSSSSSAEAPTPSTPVSYLTPGKSGLPPNPFLPYRNPTTGRWRGAHISLRRQADLVKLAKKHGVEELLPPSRKSTAFKEQRLLERGLAVKGTGEGQRVKGHKWERMMGQTVEKRIKAMEEMPPLIREWQRRGHGRGWKKFPK